MPKAKKRIAIVKVELVAGKATPGPPLGPVLGQHGVDIMSFCKDYNDQTKNQKDAGMIVPAEICIFDDRTFSFILKTPPTSVLLRKAANLDKGSSDPSITTVGELTEQQLDEIANAKLADLNTTDISAARKIIQGSAESMGIKII